MKVSIITVCYNSERTIEDTLISIRDQSYSSIELIVVDGGSTDNTLKILRKYSDLVSKVISEPDRGLYDAMNKGLSIANGEIIGFLNSDDYYPNNNVIGNVVREFSEYKVDAVYSNLNYVDFSNTRITRVWVSSKPTILNSFVNSWVPPHPTFFASKEFYVEIGFFNLKFNYAADFDILLRFFEAPMRKIKYVNETWVHMREGGTTNNSLRVIFKQNMEIFYSLKLHNKRVKPLLFIINKIRSRINQRKLARKESIFI